MNASRSIETEALQNELDHYLCSPGQGPCVTPELVEHLSHRFAIRGIRRLAKATGPTAVRTAALTPVEGGFLVLIRVPRQRARDYRFVLAHEFAHTFFYRREDKGVPQHVPHPEEESLCNYGARAILMPRRCFEGIMVRAVTLQQIVNLAAELDVYPHWVAERLLLDVHHQTAFFCTYRVGQDGTRKLTHTQVSSQPNRLSAVASRELHELAQHALNSPVPIRCRRYLGKPGEGGVFELETMACQVTNSSTQEVHVLLRTSNSND